MRGECADVSEGGVCGCKRGGVCGCMRGRGCVRGEWCALRRMGVRGSACGEYKRGACVGNRGGEYTRGTEAERMRGDEKARSGAPSHRGGARYDYRPGQAGPRASEGRVRVLAPQVPQGTSPCRRLTFVDDRPGGERFGGGRRAAMPQRVFLAGDPVDGEEFGEETDRSDKRASRGVLPCTAVVGHEESECALPTTQPAKDRAKIAERGGDVKRQARFFHRS